MPLWKKLWLLFSVIWVVVAGLNIATILAFSEEELDRQKVLLPLTLAFLVPAVTYLLAWGWVTWRRRSGSEHDLGRR